MPSFTLASLSRYARREVVGAVDDHVVAGDDVDDVGGRQPRVVGDDVDVGVEHRQRLLGRVDLAVADAVDVVQDLALQVGGVDLVHVDDADRADAGGGEVERGRRAEPAGTEQQHLRVEQLLLALDADLGQQQVALVAVHLLGGQRGGLASSRGPRPSTGRTRPPSTRRSRSRAPASCWRRTPSARRRRSRRRPASILSVIRFSTCDSRWPRGMWIAPGIAPSWYSSGSRTSSTVYPAAMRSAAVVGRDRVDRRLGGRQQIAERCHRQKPTNIESGIPSSASRQRSAHDRPAGSRRSGRAGGGRRGGPSRSARR